MYEPFLSFLDLLSSESIKQMQLLGSVICALDHAVAAKSAAILTSNSLERFDANMNNSIRHGIYPDHVRTANTPDALFNALQNMLLLSGVAPAGPLLEYYLGYLVLQLGPETGLKVALVELATHVNSANAEVSAVVPCVLQTFVLSALPLLFDTLNENFTTLTTNTSDKIICHSVTSDTASSTAMSVGRITADTSSGKKLSDSIKINSEFNFNSSVHVAVSVRDKAVQIFANLIMNKLGSVALTRLVFDWTSRAVSSES